MGYVKGPDGSNKKRIETTYNVHLFSISYNDDPEIVVKESDDKDVVAAKDHILETLLGTSIEVKKGLVGRNYSAP